jgi:DNA gyrase subunit A
MAKKPATPENDPTPQPAPERILPRLIEDDMRESYLTYAMSVIVARALPDVRDGLKPSQRRVLIAMNDLNLGPASKFRKCAKITGDTSGNYHPHGESVVYPTLVRMAQHFNMRALLVDGQGNFGTVDGDPPAAQRYTEARLTRAAVDLLEDLDRDTVDFVDNYDGTRQEPTVLPSKFPNLLVNGASGIAVGMATSMPPNNVNEVCDGIIALIKKPDISIDDLMKHIPGPDFPTGGIIHGRKGLTDAYRSGRGIITVRGKVEIEQGKNGKQEIVISEIPYQVNKTTLIEKIADLVKEDKIGGISDIQDYSSRKGMRIVVEVKRDEDARIILNNLYQHTQLQSSFSIINIALVKGRPETLNVKQLMELYRDHRKEVIRRRSVFLLAKAEKRGHILEGLIKALGELDLVIELIRKSPDSDAARIALMAKVQAAVTVDKSGEAVKVKAKAGDFLSREQADAILEMRLARLTGLERQKLDTEYLEVIREIADLKDILAREERVLAIIVEDLHNIKKRHGDERRTQIEADVGDFNVEDLIADEEMVVTISHDGYIKRVPLDQYRAQGRGGRGASGATTKEGDFVEHFFVASTHDYLLVFTTLGKLFWLKVYDIPEFSKTAKGRALVNLLSISTVERVAACIQVREFEEGRSLMFSTSSGLVKKTALTAYSNVTKKGIRAVRLNEGDRLIDVVVTREGDEVVLATKLGMSIRFRESDARRMGRVSAGVRGIALREKDEVVDIAVVNRNGTLLTVCANGFGKRTSFDEYREQHRGGKGLINIRATERNGHVVGAKSIFDGDELMLITKGGTVIRTPINQETMRAIGRATQGVRLMRVGDDDEIMSVVKIMNEETELERSEARAAEETLNALKQGGLDKLEETRASQRRRPVPVALAPEDLDEDGAVEDDVPPDDDSGDDDAGDDEGGDDGDTGKKKPAPKGKKK